MKALSKPISSPSRTEKFPTPLMMRFLRSNVGSRSRGRSRSSPMFIMRTKKNAEAINETQQQEPSSPKVTCIGQVRARRSSRTSSASSKSKRIGRSTTPSKRPQRSPCSCCCCGVQRTRLFHRFASRFHKPRPFCASFPKWVLFFRFGYCKKVDTRDDSSRFESIQRSQNHACTITISTASDIEDYEGNVKETHVIQETKEGFLESSTPPKNALLLTRCRSAPYRSSSLASKFWGSPLGSSETDTMKNELEEPAGGGETERALSPNLGNEAAESRNSSSHEEEGEELDCSSNGRTKEVKTPELKSIGGGGGSVHPLLLTRCKSEPARTGERLVPEANCWGQRRSATAESCLEHSNCD